MSSYLIVEHLRVPKALVLTLLFIISGPVWSATYNQGFETHNVTQVADFIHSGNGVTANYTGGTAFTIGLGSLYHGGSTSWMLEPAGSNARGTHPGTGSIIFDQDVMSLSFFYVANSSQLTTDIQLLDSNGNGVENAPVFNQPTNNFQQLSFAITAGSAAIRRVNIDVTGSGMFALDTLLATTDSSGAASGSTTPAKKSSSGGGIFWMLIILGILKYKRSRASNLLD